MLTTPSLINQPQIFPRVSTANYDVETSAVFWGKDEASVHIGGGEVWNAASASSDQGEGLGVNSGSGEATEALSDIVKDLL